MVTEAIVLAIALLAGGAIRAALKGDSMFASWMWYLIAAWIIGAMVARLVPGWGLGPVEELRRSVLLLAGVFAATTAMLFWGKAAHETSRFTLTAGLFLSVVMIPLARISVKRLLIRMGVWGVPVAVYADAPAARAIVEALTHERGLGYAPACFFTDDPNLVRRGFQGVHAWGTLKENTQEVPIAILSLQGSARGHLNDLLEGPLSIYRKVVVIPDIADAPSLWIKPRDLVGMLGLEISSNLLDPSARIIKRSADLIICILSAPLWMPFCLLLTVLVWLEDRGNPIFKQSRVGRYGAVFNTWKFRTMHPDAESLLQKHLAENEAIRAEWEANFKLRDDPRITRIGRFLRRTSLDELPQLVNVLRGEMSLVGPRPLPAYHDEGLPGRVRALRARVRPGVTGLWQVSGRSEAGHAGMQKWDTYYVRNWSIWLDIVILFRTIRTVASGHGAF